MARPGIGAQIALPIPSGRRALFTAVFAEEDDAGWTHVFEAAVCSSRAEFMVDLVRRHGRRALRADVLMGIASDSPLVQALASPAIIDMLEQVGCEASSPLGDGLRVSIEQEFRS